MQSIVEQDFGTPGRHSDKTVTLSIDGQEISVPEGTSVMRAAALLGSKIPKLCATDQLEAFGSCRLCLVQIEGMKGMPASCTTPVAAGMKVTTQNKQLADVRRGVMELYISDHPLDCLTCPANGHCELQDMAGVVGSARSALRLRGCKPSRHAPKDDQQSVLHLRREQVHRLLALRARLRRTAGHSRAHHPKPRLRFESFCQPERRRSWIRNASPAAPACRPVLPPPCPRRA